MTTILEEGECDAIVQIEDEINFRTKHPDALLVRRVVWIGVLGPTLDGTQGVYGYPIFLAYF
jgi:hypothetical protein